MVWDWEGLAREITGRHSLHTRQLQFPFSDRDVLVDQLDSVAASVVVQEVICLFVNW